MWRVIEMLYEQYTTRDFALSTKIISISDYFMFLNLILDYK